VAISEAVYEEAVLRGVEKGFEDARLISEAIEDGWIEVFKAGKQFTDKIKDAESRLNIELGRGERETTALALERGISILLTDDEDAYRMAKSLGINPKGTLYVLLESVKKGHMNKEQAKQHIGQMLEEGFWISPAIIHNFHETLDKL